MKPRYDEEALLRELAKRRRKVKSREFTLDPRFEKQNAVVNSTARFIAAQCSRRAGKSNALALKFFKTMETHPKAQCIYLALTFDSAQSIMWPVLQELNEKMGLGCTFVDGKMVMTHPNGSTLRLYGADQKNFVKRLKGQKSPGIAIDEAQDFGTHLQSLIDDILTPMMVDYPDSWLAVTGTPGPVPQGYFFDITKNKKFGYENHEWTILDNPYIQNAEEFIISLIATKEWEANNPTLLREWRNQWVLDVQALWIRYKSDVNNFGTLPNHIKDWNYILGIDVGFRDADALALLAYSDLDPCTYLVEEIVTEKQGLTPLVDQVQALRAEHNIVRIVIDQGGLGLKLAEEMRVRYGIPVEGAEKQRKQETVEYLNDSLRTGRFKAREKSRFAQDSYLVQIDWEKSTPDKIVIKKKPHSDIIDAVIYAFKISPAYMYQPAVKTPKLGSEADMKAQEALHLQSALEQAKKQKDGEETKAEYGSWEKDSKGIASWLKW